MLLKEIVWFWIKLLISKYVSDKYQQNFEHAASIAKSKIPIESPELEYY